MLPSRCMLPSLRSATSSKLPPLCTCESRRPGGEMQAVPCGARSDTRLFPASGSQPRSAQIRPVRTYKTRIYFYVEVKTVLKFLRHVQLSRKKRSTGSSRRFHFARASTSVRPRGGRAPVSPCLHPCPRTHGKIRGRNAPGLRAREPHTNRK